MSVSKWAGSVAASVSAQKPATHAASSTGAFSANSMNCSAGVGTMFLRGATATADSFTTGSDPNFSLDANLAPAWTLFMVCWPKGTSFWSEPNHPMAGGGTGVLLFVLRVRRYEIQSCMSQRMSPSGSPLWKFEKWKKLNLLLPPQTAQTPNFKKKKFSLM